MMQDEIKVILNRSRGCAATVTKDNSARLNSLSPVFRGEGRGEGPSAELRSLDPSFSRGLKNRASGRAVFQTAAKRGNSRSRSTPRSGPANERQILRSAQDDNCANVSRMNRVL